LPFPPSYFPNIQYELPSSNEGFLIRFTDSADLKMPLLCGVSPSAASAEMELRKLRIRISWKESFIARCMFNV